MTDDQPTILILGAGINGAALARELVLNRVSVVLVDTADLASGTTSYSSRLIHGGLRYLEYGELALVRESLAERGRLLRLAPQHVKPLRFHIPIRNRWGGWRSALGRVLGLAAPANVSRGLWLVRFGLALYDLLARKDGLPASDSSPVDSRSRPALNPSCFRWRCSYSDAQVLYPERLVVSLLSDARRFAAQSGVPFQLLTYHHAQLRDGVVRITEDGREVTQIRPAAAINATGAWVDCTLADWQVGSRRLMGGTKGAHLIVDNRALVEQLNGDAVYVEAADGRPVFLLPFGDATLIGTTDLAFDGDPGDAVATPEEISYLLTAANEVFPLIRLTSKDVALHYAGVRPLPHVASAGSTGSITRRHSLEEHGSAILPIYSVVGGKLTTCRALAEEVSRVILARLQLPYRADSRERPLPGGERYPADQTQLDEEIAGIAQATGLSGSQVASVWPLFGTETGELLGRPGESESLAGTEIPVRLVRSVIRNEWVNRLSDLVERRLMLLYHRGLTEATLQQLAELLCEEGKLPPADVADQVSHYRHRLAAKFGRVVTSSGE